MKVGLKLARVGMNMEEATITRWRKKAGDPFRKGEPLYDIETEKVTMEVEAPCDGILLEPHVAEGDNAEVGQVVCTIEQD
ncbi:MAG: lipoyl domain-containing protein [Betaproteobacteria bacterium]|nr:lipoyl domain-containing protein [Betaproteobacteria bacterium]